ncbi:MAG: hypothetical protein PHI68_04305, partial [Candidatus Cloacimonetes bacterium]|nr:hypothetical protein [Candidatus Cloacimonadota bacterium]
MYLPYQDLEFGKILRQISQRCDSLLARELAEGLVPLSSLPLIRQELAINDEFTSACEHGYGFDFSHLTSLDPLFVEKQVLIFDYEELLVIYQNALLGNLVHQGLGNCEHYPRILKLAKKLVPLPEITQRFVQIFDPEGEILDGASPELSKIRKSINGLRSRIIRTMQSLIQDSSLEKFLQDKFVTQRNDRYVLPIKDTCSSQVKGIVQGQSAKGSTIFVEPESVVPMSNELQLLIQEEKREIYRILSIYSDVINAASGYLLDNTSLLSEFDLRFAIGKLSRELHSEVPEIGEEPYLDLKAARHPLLILKLDDFSRVIPFELELGKDKDILIVSGPNTGGKTVLLKAVGLITLMALSGLPVPVDKKSKIGYFEPVYADVGDDQSIENALSAFSAHLDKIRRMIGNCGRQTLILIDEIGAATDPTQGSALAQAMLEHFISCQ